MSKRRRKLTAFKLHCTGLSVHWEILQVHRAGQGKSQPEMEETQIGREKRSNGRDVKRGPKAQWSSKKTNPSSLFFEGLTDYKKGKINL